MASTKAPLLPGTLITTRRLDLRRFCAADELALWEIHRDAEVTRFLGNGQPFARADNQRWLRRTLWYQSAHGAGQLAVCRREDGCVIGRCGVTPFVLVRAGSALPEIRQIDDRPAPGGHRFIELGFTFGRAYWGQGYATEAALAVRDHEFAVMGRRELVSCVQPTNTASVRVTRRIGFERRGAALMFGQRVDRYAGKNPGGSGDGAQV